MAKYLHLFDSASAFTEAYNGNDYHEPWVSYTEANEHVDYNKIPIVPLTFEVLSSGTINFGNYRVENETTIEYRKNGGEWTEIQSSPMGLDWHTNLYTGGTEIQVNSGDIVCFRGSNETYSNDGWAFYGFCPSTCVFNLKGNIMSLLGGEKDTLESAYTFYNMFYGCEGLIDVHELSLPATTLSEGCYMSLFGRCSNLISVPELPATTLGKGCYNTMFNGCASLVNVPLNLLTAPTSLEEDCYNQMFVNCSSLSTLPTLPLTTLAPRCYFHMFGGCESITTIPSNYLPSTTLAESAYTGMFAGCTSLTATPNLTATIIPSYCYSEMFNCCRGLTTISPLSATNLSSFACYRMFEECDSLTTLPSDLLPVTALSTYCCASMFYGCDNLTTAPDLIATTLVESCYLNMFNWCSRLASVKCLATDITANNCTKNWMSSVPNKGTFTKASSTSWSRDKNGIPTGWTVVNA